MYRNILRSRIKRQQGEIIGFAKNILFIERLLDMRRTRNNAVTDRNVKMSLLKIEKNVLIENAIAINVVGVKKFREKAIILIYVGYNYTLLCHLIVNLFAER